MSRLATQADFEQGGMYDPPYWRFPFFATRASSLQSNFPGISNILIAGCGYGYLVDALLQLGIPTWGCDASSYAVNKAQTVLSANSASHVLLGDALSTTSLANVVAGAGLHKNGKFGLVITEDLLPCAATDAEAQTMVSNLRVIGTNVVHIVTTGTIGVTNISPEGLTLLWHTLAQWKALVTPDQVWDAQYGNKL